MLFSCVTITTKSRAWILPEAVRCFLEQAPSHIDCELVIVCPRDHVDVVANVVQSAPNIRVEGIDPVDTEGGRRNAAIVRCAGDWIVTWDDDDWAEPHRLRKIAAAVAQDPAVELVGTVSMLIYELKTAKAWRYTYRGPEKYLIGGTLALSKKFWERCPYPLHTGVNEHQTGSDAALVVPALAAGTPYAVIDSDYVALVHGGNIANPEIPRYLSDPYYQSISSGSEYIDALTNGWATRARVAHASRTI